MISHCSCSDPYPMVAPNYAASRSALAKTMGLGRKPAQQQKGRVRKTAV
jgi:predicted transcriptional regulator